MFLPRQKVHIQVLYKFSQRLQYFTKLLKLIHLRGLKLCLKLEKPSPAIGPLKVLGGGPLEVGQLCLHLLRGDLGGQGRADVREDFRVREQVSHLKLLDKTRKAIFDDENIYHLQSYLFRFIDIKKYTVMIFFIILTHI